MVKMKINYELLPIKAHYFFFLAAMGPILPSLPVIGKQLGISEVVMGLINGCLPLLYILVKPAFGFLIDYFHEWRKAVFITLLLATGAIFALMSFIPHHNQQVIDTVDCEALRHCPELPLSNFGKCDWKCDNNSKMVLFDSNLTCTRENITCPKPSMNCTINCSNLTPVYMRISFWAFLLLMSLGTIGYNVSNSISDAICFDILGEGEEMKYGRQRVWGTIGFGLTALLGGFLIDHISEGLAFKSYTPAYLTAAACMLFDVLCSFKLRLPPLPKSKNILKDIGGLIKQPHIASFLIFATLIGMCDAAMIFYLLWFLEDLAEKTDEVANIKLLQGLTVAAETLFGEVLFFSISGKILSKIGYGHCLTMCFLFYALRLGLVSILTSPWWVLPIEIALQGPTYALAYTTIVAYASAVSPPGTSGTVQGLVAGMDDGIGYAIGSLAGGVLYRFYGGSMMFLLASTLAATSAISHCFLYLMFFKNSIEKPKVSVSSKEARAMPEMVPLKAIKSSMDLKAQGES